MIRTALAVTALALCAFLVVAAVVAGPSDLDVVSPNIRDVPLPTLMDIERAGEEADRSWQAMIDEMLHNIITPTPYLLQDYDSDGVLDLIRSEVDGETYVYPNAGTNDAPLYGPGLIYQGPELVYPEIERPSSQQTATSGDEDITIVFDRFDVVIDETYYANNQADIDHFFAVFESRLETLEGLTGWSAERFYDQKLVIYADIITERDVCYGGHAGSGQVFLAMDGDSFYPTDPWQCKAPYFVDGIPYFDNPGELGDYWNYMRAAVHETVHAINPYAILERGWLTEGFARYNGHNILVTYSDINQETADYDLYQGTNYYNWPGYVGNDYHDLTPYQYEIQDSRGYAITAWMFTMLREDYSINWNEFYDLMSNNNEPLDKAYELGGEGPASRYTDMVVIDMFGHTLGMTFPEIQAVFRYDGPSGPGWGVRDWVPIDWYPDLTPSLGFSKSDPVPGETIDLAATVYNNGDTDANEFSVRFYEGVTLLDEQIVSLPANSSLLVTSPYTGSEGMHTLSVFIDEDNVTMETDETNNEDSESIAFVPCCADRVGDANGLGGDEPTIGDISVMIDAKFISGTCDGILTCFAEADVNQSGGSNPTCDDITIGDISTLIDYLFITGSGLGLADCL